MARGMDDSDAQQSDGTGCAVAFVFVLMVAVAVVALARQENPDVCAEFRYCEVVVDGSICLYDDHLDKLKTD